MAPNYSSFLGEFTPGEVELPEAIASPSSISVVKTYIIYVGNMSHAPLTMSAFLYNLIWSERGNPLRDNPQWY